MTGAEPAPNVPNAPHEPPATLGARLDREARHRLALREEPARTAAARTALARHAAERTRPGRNRRMRVDAPVEPVRIGEVPDADELLDAEPMVEADRPGRPLPGDVQETLRPVIGPGLERVTVHDDAPADALARRHGADAVTVGEQISFRTGRFRPREPAGRALVAHEAWHAVQARGAGVGWRRAGPGGRAEEEAEAAHRAHAAHGVASWPSPAPGLSGFVGPAGPPGATGAGAHGAGGAPGRAGASGPSGPPGSPGSPGWAGPAGTTGAVGWPAQPDHIGSTGPGAPPRPLAERRGDPGWPATTAIRPRGAAPRSLAAPRLGGSAPGPVPAAVGPVVSSPAAAPSAAHTPMPAAAGSAGLPAAAPPDTPPTAPPAAAPSAEAIASALRTQMRIDRERGA